MEQRWLQRLLISFLVLSSSLWGVYIRSRSDGLFYCSVIASGVALILFCEWAFLGDDWQETSPSSVLLSVVCKCGAKILVWSSPGILPTVSVTELDVDKVLDVVESELGLSEFDINSIEVLTMPRCNVNAVVFNIPPSCTQFVDKGRFRFVERDVFSLTTQARRTVELVESVKKSDGRVRNVGST